MKFTPGPWRVHDAGGGCLTIRAARDRRAIATIPWTITRLGAVGQKPDSWELCVGNSALLAAAPSLYAACKVVALTPEIRNWLTVHDPNALEQVLAAIRAAEAVGMVERKSDGNNG